MRDIKASFHNVSRKSVNHWSCWWFIDFDAWRYFTLRRDVIIMINRKDALTGILGNRVD